MVKEEEKKEEVEKSTNDDETLNPMLAEAKSLAERIEEGNKKAEELQKKQEALLAEQMLGGIGGRVELKPKVETDDEYSARIAQELKEGKYNE